jgi:hypothetical protein
VTITLGYSAPGDASTLKLYRWSTNAWVDAATDCQPVSSYDRSAAGKIVVKVCQTGSFALAGNMQPAASRVVNGASFLTSTVSPGAFVSIFGSNLAKAAAQAAASPLPNTLGGVTVTMTGSAGSVQAPLYYVSPEQINLQIPFEVAPGNATLTITRDGLQGRRSRSR